jgi:microcystin degradation protein MlrC
MLYGLDAGRTTSPGPMTEMLERAARLESEPGVLVVSVHAGFGWSDIPDAGPSNTVTGDGQDAKYREIAEGLMDEAWRTRQQGSTTFYSVAEAMEVAETPDRSGKPLVLADFTDNPGGGGYGDATNLLAGMLSAQLANAAFAPISDPAAVRECMAAGTGARLSLEIGGRIDPAFGPPLRVVGTVRHLGDGAYVCDGPMWQGLKMSMGDCAVLRVAGIDILLASNRFQITDLQQFLSVGIDPRKKAVIGLKSSQHFRAAFQPIARKVLIVDAGALTSPDFTRFSYTKLRRPIWPLDDLQP